MVLGPVCDDNWDQLDALVVCRQLGYRHALPTWDSWFGGVYGEVVGDFSMDEVNCNGNETRLEECFHNSRLSLKCERGHGAGVICSNTGPGKVLFTDEYYSSNMGIEKGSGGHS